MPMPPPPPAAAAERHPGVKAHVQWVVDVRARGEWVLGCATELWYAPGDRKTGQALQPRALVVAVDEGGGIGGVARKLLLDGQWRNVRLVEVRNCLLHCARALALLIKRMHSAQVHACSARSAD